MSVKGLRGSSQSNIRTSAGIRPTLRNGGRQCRQCRHRVRPEGLQGVHTCDVLEQCYETDKELPPEGPSNKAHGASNIHRVPKDVEREPILFDLVSGLRADIKTDIPFNAVVHEDAKVIPKECPGYPQSPG
jgi:hypothetical protein